MTGLDRNQAAAWVTGTTGHPVSEANIRYWERVGLLPRQRPGSRVPATYRLDHLVLLRLVAELRREGAPLQRIRRAVTRLIALFSDLKDRPGAWRLAVTSTGDIHYITNLNLYDLSRAPGQSGWLFLLDLREYVNHARQAVHGGTPRMISSWRD